MSEPHAYGWKVWRLGRLCIVRMRGNMGARFYFARNPRFGVLALRLGNWSVEWWGKMR